MQIVAASGLPETADRHESIRARYVWTIAFVAAMGGLLFGYDWVVIGGAKPFYEAYFHLTSPQLIGWANSCALIGCFIGALVGGAIGDRFGRRRTLLLAAFLFAVSSLLTGWAHTFTTFIVWRIVGGLAIGLASNVSPLYIAEISPAALRGRLVSLNQLSIVIGILLAQLVNWRIAQPVPADATMATIAASWNARSGWRWMFTAVSLPASLFFLCSLGIPESPRWLLLRNKTAQANEILSRIGGPTYAARETNSIMDSLRRTPHDIAGWREVLAPGVRWLLLIGIVLAVLQQWSGINILFNYAEEVYRSAGYGLNDILFDIVITGTINLLFTVLAMFFVDRLGRRALMLFGCVGVGLSHFCAGLAYRFGLHGAGVLLLTLCAIACYAVSLAPVTWVLISEIFPNRVRGLAVSIAVAALWCASFLLTYTFPILNRQFGTANVFFLYSAICFLGGVFIYKLVRETAGRSLEEIERASATPDHFTAG
jgi:MFS transporter, SP family, xylose:H+ symportor